MEFHITYFTIWILDFIYARNKQEGIVEYIDI